MQNSIHKSRLTAEIKLALLSKESYLGALADKVGTKGYTIKVQLNADSPTLCLPHYLKAIREVLGIPATDPTELVDIYPVNSDSHLHQ